MPRMPSILLLSIALFAASPDSGPGWEQAARDEGITVYSRQKKGTNVNEMKAIGLVDAPPPDVFRAIRDYAHYDQNMPFTEDSKVLEVQEEGKVIYFYSCINAPLVARRDYVIKILDESDWQDGKGFLLVTWSAADKLPEKEGRIRVKINDGFWRLEPRDNGTKTFATYYVYTDPGGSLPTWVVNRANGSAVPDVFRAVRKAVKKK